MALANIATGFAPATIPRHCSPMTPKQCAAKLLLNILTAGAQHPRTLDRLQMADALGTRISDEKREKILGFVSKIEDPVIERLTRLAGEGAEEAAAEAAG
jgi:hypothetical protein